MSFITLSLICLLVQFLLLRQFACKALKYKGADANIFSAIYTPFALAITCFLISIVPISTDVKRVLLLAPIFGGIIFILLIVNKLHVNLTSIKQLSPPMNFWIYTNTVFGSVIAYILGNYILTTASIPSGAHDFNTYLIQSTLISETLSITTLWEMVTANAALQWPISHTHGFAFDFFIAYFLSADLLLKSGIQNVDRLTYVGTFAQAISSTLAITTTFLVYTRESRLRLKLFGALFLILTAIPYGWYVFHSQSIDGFRFLSIIGLVFISAKNLESRFSSNANLIILCAANAIALYTHTLNILFVVINAISMIILF